MKANDVTHKKQKEELTPLPSSSNNNKVMITPLKSPSFSKSTTCYRSKSSHKRRERRKRQKSRLDLEAISLCGSFCDESECRDDEKCSVNGNETESIETEANIDIK